MPFVNRLLLSMDTGKLLNLLQVDGDVTRCLWGQRDAAHQLIASFLEQRDAKRDQVALLQ